MKDKIHVHVADDHKILIEGIIAVLNTDKDIEVAGYSLTGKEVLDWFTRNEADVLILDINMPELDGIEVLQEFNARKFDQKTIILSSYDDVKLVQELISIGANGFLAKKSAGEHIIQAIKAVASGEQYFSDDIQKNLINLYTTGRSAESEGEKLDRTVIQSITDRELEVLKLISKEYSTAEIADFLNLSVNTIETYRKSLLKKINVKNAVGLAMYAVKHKII